MDRLVDGSLGLSDRDGMLCVTCCISDYNAPKLHRHHWPTTVRTRDALAHMQVDSLDALHVEKSMPGEYAIRRVSDVHFPYVSRVSLIDGPRTQPVWTEIIDYPPPARAREKEYRHGKWYVRRAGRMVAA